jgi:hypothetical protein
MAVTINASTSAGLVQTADTSGVLQLQTAGTAAVTVDASQNVGIGTAPNTWSLGKVLQIGNTTELWNDGSNSTYLSNNTYYNSDFKYQVTGVAATYYVSGAGTHAWHNAPSGTAGATATFTERMRIDSSGNLLVGTTSNKGNGITVQSGGNTVWTTSTGLGQSALVVQNAGTNTGSSADLVAFQIGTSGGGTGVGSIKYNGSLTVYATTSDYRLKENVKPMVGALSIVSQLNPVTYNWTESKVKGQGFIAHELQAAIPDAVVGIKDAVDSKGNAVYQQIDTSVLVATLTAAIQEMKAIIDAQSARITALENK